MIIRKISAIVDFYKINFAKISILSLLVIFNADETMGLTHCINDKGEDYFTGLKLCSDGFFPETAPKIEKIPFPQKTIGVLFVDTTIHTLFRLISQQSSLIINANTDDLGRKITIKSEDISIQGLFFWIIDNAKLSYEYKGGQIYIGKNQDVVINEKIVENSKPAVLKAPNPATIETPIEKTNPKPGEDLKVTNYGIGDIGNSTKENEEEIKNKDIYSKEFSFIPMWRWSAGMKFVFRENISSLGINLRPYVNNNVSLDIKGSDYARKLFELDRIEERNVTCPRGQCVRTYFIFKMDGQNKILEYEYIGSLEEMKSDTSETFQAIPDLAYIGDIEKARSLLVGKTFYILKRDWEGDKVAINIRKCFIPVEIVEVGFSNDMGNDASIVFKTQDGIKAYVNVILSGTNKEKTFKMSRLVNKFEDLFALDNPRLTYKGREEVWEDIVKGAVKPGFTEEEVVWSWGKPKQINKSYPGPDQWVYNSKNLYFENGIVTGFN